MMIVSLYIIFFISQSAASLYNNYEEKLKLKEFLFERILEYCRLVERSLQVGSRGEVFSVFSLDPSKPILPFPL